MHKHKGIHSILHYTEIILQQHLIAHGLVVYQSLDNLAVSVGSSCSICAESALKYIGAIIASN